MRRPRLLDLYCCAGGAAMGYHCSGFDVVGVDVKEQPRFPFEFVCGDALEYLSSRGSSFDAVHASPPCQAHSAASKQDGYGRRRETNPHRDWIDATRDLLVRTGLPYVIENVVGAPLRADLMLCGKMFDLDVVRHRVFELGGFRVPQPRHRPHTGRVITVTGNTGGSSTRDGKARFANLSDRSKAMGIDWMLNRELVEALPPVYTAYIGRFLYRSCIGTV